MALHAAKIAVLHRILTALALELFMRNLQGILGAIVSAPITVLVYNLASLVIHPVFVDQGGAKPDGCYDSLIFSGEARQNLP